MIHVWTVYGIWLSWYLGEGSRRGGRGRDGGRNDDDGDGECRRGGGDRESGGVRRGGGGGGDWRKPSQGMATVAGAAAAAGGKETIVGRGVSVSGVDVSGLPQRMIGPAGDQAGRRVPAQSSRTRVNYQSSWKRVQ